MASITAHWVNSCSRQSLEVVLAEYRYLVRRFPQWLSLTIGRCEDEKVRQLLVPNLVEECGVWNDRASHLSLLDQCLRTCGVPVASTYAPLKSTQEAERWFFDVFSNEPTYVQLCVLGPGTEAVSQCFLKPLEQGLRNGFPESTVDFSYFEAHKTEMEEIHVRNIEEAITHIEQLDHRAQPTRRDTMKAKWIALGIHAHQTFWDGLKSHLSTNLS